MSRSLLEKLGLEGGPAVPRYDRLLRANTQYRRFLTANLVTRTGDVVHLMAAMWLVHSLTGSTAMTGFAAFLARAPRLFNFLAGPLVDRVATNRALFWTQVTQGTTVLTVPVAAYLGYLSVELVLLTIPIASLFNTFEGPAMSSAVPRLVADEDVTRANSMESVLHHARDLVANPIGGVVIALFGAVVLFGVNVVSFYVASAFFLVVQFPDGFADGGEGVEETDGIDADRTDAVTSLRGRVRDHLAEVAEGFGYIRTTLLLNVVVGLTLSQVAIGATRGVAPMYSDLRGGSEFYGLLLAASSVGTLTGNVLASSLEEYPVSRLVTGVTAAGAVLWVVAINFPLPLGTLALYVLATVPLGMVSTLMISLIHTSLDDARLGRVVATVTTFTGVATPIGALLGGVLAESLGARTTFTLAASGYVVLFVFFLADGQLRSLPAVEYAEVEYGESADSE